MHYIYKLVEQAIINIIKRHIKAIEKQNLSTTLNLKHQTRLLRITLTLLKYSKTKPKDTFVNYIWRFTSRKTKIIFTLANSTIKQQKHYRLTSSNLRKILTDNTIIICKNNNKKRLQIHEAICIKDKKNKHK